MEKNLASKIVMSFNALLIIHQNMYVENKSKNFNKLFDAFLEESVELLYEVRVNKKNYISENSFKRMLSNYFQVAIEKGKPVTETQFIIHIVWCCILKSEAFRKVKSSFVNIKSNR